MKNNPGKKIQPTIFMRPIIVALVAAFSLALLIILAIWGFNLRSITKWFIQAGILAIPLTIILHLIIYRKNIYRIEFDICETIINAGTAILLTTQIIPDQLTIERTFTTSIVTALLFFVLYTTLFASLLNRLEIRWEKALIWIILISGIVSMSLIFKNILYARMYADDFCYAVNYDQLGFPGAGLYFYREWSGRFFSNFFVMGLADQPITIFFLLAISIVAIFILLLQVNIHQNRDNHWVTAAASSVFFIPTLIFLAPDFYKTLFWTGSTLVLFPVIILISLFLIASLQFLRSNKSTIFWWMVFASLLSVCITTTHEVASLGWLFIILISIILTLSLKNVKRSFTYYLIGAAIGAIGGLVVMLLSPGIDNRAQIQNYPGATPLIETVFITMRNMLEFFSNITFPYYFFEINGRAGLLFIVGLIGLGWSLDVNYKRNWIRAITVLIVFLLMVMTTFFPGAYVYRGNIPLRSQMIPVFFLTTGFFLFSLNIPKSTKISIDRAVYIFVITSVVLGMRLIIPQMLSIMEPLQQYASDWDARDQKYIQSTEIPPRIDIPWEEYEQNIDCIELYYAHLTDMYGSN